MLKNLPIILSQKFYPLFLIYSQIISYFLWVSKNDVQNAIQKLSCRYFCQ